MLRKRHGTSLMELVGVILITAILTVSVGVSVSKNSKRAIREQATSDMQVFANALAEAYYDLGEPPETDSLFDRWLNSVSSTYLSVKFEQNYDFAPNGYYHVVTKQPVDPWGTPYEFWFVTNEGTMKYAVIASGGENGVVEVPTWGVTGTTSFSDDIVVIVRPKV